MTAEDATRPPEGKELVRLRVPARAAMLKDVRDTVRSTLTQAGMDAKLVSDVVLAVDEACQNIIRHAYGRECDNDVVVDIRQDGAEVLIYVRDFADPVNVDNIRARDLGDVKPGGLGVHFIHEVMDEVEYRPLENGEGNVLRMVKRIA